MVTAISLTILFYEERSKVFSRFPRFLKGFSLTKCKNDGSGQRKHFDPPPIFENCHCAKPGHPPAGPHREAPICRSSAHKNCSPLRGCSCCIYAIFSWKIRSEDPLPGESTTVPGACRRSSFRREALPAAVPAPASRVLPVFRKLRPPGFLRLLRSRASSPSLPGSPQGRG